MWFKTMPLSDGLVKLNNKNKNMYYEEKIIDGILHFKVSPRGKWRAYCQEELTRMLVKNGYKLA